MFESRARNAVSSSWGVLTPDVQSACIEATRSPADRSWRVLAGCIEIETRRIKSKRAIATRDTPAAEPEAKSSAEPPAAAPAAPTPATPAEPATAN